MAERIFNFLPIGGGGGLQNALSFIENLESVAGIEFIARQGSLVDQALTRRNAAIRRVGHGKLGRVWFELGRKGMDLNGRTVFSIFGPPFLRESEKTLNINGFALSNLFYPEIDFWKYCSRLEKTRRYFIDAYRRYYYRKADFWIFETPVMQERAVNMWGFPEERTAVVKMTPSSLVGPELADPQKKEEFKALLPQNKFLFLFLNLPHPNKRIHLLPEIAVEIKKQNITDCAFVLTMNKEHSYTKEVYRKIHDLGVEEYFCNIGGVPQPEISSLLSCVNVLCTFSVLESFSNNFVEAWKMRLPLVVTDADWSRGCCGDGAVYVSPEKSADAADQLICLMHDSAERERVVMAGEAVLRSMPSAKEKNRLYWACIAKAEALGKMDNAQRGMVFGK